MNRHDRQTQDRSGRDLAVCGRFDSQRELEPYRTPARQTITEARVTLPAQPALEFPSGHGDSPKAGAKIHAPSIYPSRGKATPEATYSNLLGYAPSLSAPITAIFPVAFGKRTTHGRLQEWLWMSAILLAVGNVAYWMTRLGAAMLA